MFGKISKKCESVRIRVDQVDHGDHDPSWWTRRVQDHLGPRSDISLMQSAPYFGRATDLGLTLLNTPGVYTRFPFSDTHRPSTINLAFANPHMFSAFRSWDASSLPSTGSDHAPIAITLRPPTPHNNTPRPRWQEPDWPGLEDRLKNWLISPPPLPPLPQPT